MNERDKRSGQLRLLTVEEAAASEGNHHHHPRQAAASLPTPADTIFSAEFLDAVGDGEVICYDLWGTGKWVYGIVSNRGRLGASIYDQLSERGVPSHTYGRGDRDGVELLRFRMARPEEYADLEFSYGMSPGFRRH